MGSKLGWGILRGCCGRGNGSLLGEGMVEERDFFAVFAGFRGRGRDVCWWRLVGFSARIILADIQCA